MKDTLISIFSKDGTLSSSRIAHYIALISGILLATYSTIYNGVLNVEVLIALLTAGTGGYAVAKVSDNGVKNV